MICGIHFLEEIVVSEYFWEFLLNWNTLSVFAMSPASKA